MPELLEPVEGDTPADRARFERARQGLPPTEALTPELARWLATPERAA